MLHFELSHWAILATFTIGFVFIAWGKYLNGLLIALLTAFVGWFLVALSTLKFEKDKLTGEDKLISAFPLNDFYHLLGDTANIFFFLVFALVIVEVVKSYNGFQFLLTWFIKHSKISDENTTEKLPNKHDIKTLSFNKLLWVVTLTSFFLASLIDNVTAALIITVSLLQLIKGEKEIKFLAFFGGVIGANAGGTFSPIGEITTTQLWAGGQITFVRTVIELFIPSLLSVVLPLWLFSTIKKDYSIQTIAVAQHEINHVPAKHTKIIIFTALFTMLGIVPFLKGFIGLPPAMGVLFAFCVLWLVIEYLNKQIVKVNSANSSQQPYHVLDVKHIFSHLEWETPLFFLGILMAVATLKVEFFEITTTTNGITTTMKEGILAALGTDLNQWLATLPFPALHKPIVAFGLGDLSAFMDNVAQVSVVQGLYPMTLQGYEQDSIFWFFVSYCAGTGGSMLVFGSAAGVAVRDKLVKIGTANETSLNHYYFYNISLWAVCNYCVGYFIYLLRYFLIA